MPSLDPEMANVCPRPFESNGVILHLNDAVNEFKRSDRHGECYTILGQNFSLRI